MFSFFLDIKLEIIIFFSPLHRENVVNRKPYNIFNNTNLQSMTFSVGLVFEQFLLHSIYYN